MFTPVARSSFLLFPAVTAGASQRGDRMSLRLAYHWDRFSAQGAARLIAGLEALILAVLEQPETRLSPRNSRGCRRGHAPLRSVARAPVAEW